MSRLSSIIVDAAARRGLTHREIGERVGVNARTIDRIVKGRTVPHVSTTRRLADALAIDPATLLEARLGALHGRAKAETRQAAEGTAAHTNARGSRRLGLIAGGALVVALLLALLSALDDLDPMTVAALVAALIAAALLLAWVIYGHTPRR